MRERTRPGAIYLLELTVLQISITIEKIYIALYYVLLIT